MGSLGSRTVNEKLYEFLKTYKSDDKEILFIAGKNFYKTFNYPKFKAKKSSTQSFNCYKGARIEDDYIILAKPRASNYTEEDLKIRFKRHKVKYDFEKVTNFTISRENNKYYISFTFYTFMQRR